MVQLCYYHSINYILKWSILRCNFCHNKTKKTKTKTNKKTKKKKKITPAWDWGVPFNFSQGRYCRWGRSNGLFFTSKKKKRKWSEWKEEWVWTKQLGLKLQEKVMTDQKPRFLPGVGLKKGLGYRVENRHWVERRPGTGRLIHLPSSRQQRNKEGRGLLFSSTRGTALETLQGRAGHPGVERLQQQPEQCGVAKTSYVRAITSPFTLSAQPQQGLRRDGRWSIEAPDRFQGKQWMLYKWLQVMLAGLSDSPPCPWTRCWRVCIPHSH